MARFDGKLIKWNDDRGFGFITANQSDSEIFVHISAFPKNGPRPYLGELITFEIDVDKEGKKRAINVFRAAGAREKKTYPSTNLNSPSRFCLIVLLLLLVSLGVYGYTRFSHRMKIENPTASHQLSEAIAATQPQLNALCDGRTHCSQMTSCKEAKFFLKNCPGTQMDGNNDGTPCEQQWCTN
jgi:cold shock CspA family protein